MFLSYDPRQTASEWWTTIKSSTRWVEIRELCQFDLHIAWHYFLFATTKKYLFTTLIHSYNDSSRSHGGNNNGPSNLENFNTYGLSVKFLEGLGITHGPLHNKCFVANVSIALCSWFLFPTSHQHLNFETESGKLEKLLRWKRLIYHAEMPIVTPSSVSLPNNI